MDRTPHKSILIQQLGDPYRKLVESVLDYAIFLLDETGHVQSWNAGAQRIKGYAASEIIGEHFSRFYPDEAVAKGWPEYELKEAAALGRFEDEGWRVRKDGTQFWANVVITALYDDAHRVCGFAKVTRDLTERRAHEEALRRSEERFRLMVQNVSDYGIFMLDAEGRVASWNAGAARIKGYTADEIIGEHFSRFYPPEAVDAGWPQRELELAIKNGSYEDEGWRVRKDGSRFWANVVITALYDDEGRPYGFAKLTRDLTERRRTEALRSSHKRLTEFLAMLAHELRNPLAPLRNATEILRIRPEDAATVERSREMIERQVALLSRLVDDLLDVSRATSGKITVKRAPVDLNGIAQRGLESVRPIAEARGQTLVSVGAGEPLIVEGDAVRLSQVIGNLLTNAVKYTPQGGSIHCEVAREEEQAVLRIRDTGVGIAPELLPHVFELFTQGDRSLDRAEGGLGIGLALVERLVRLHGGSVDVTSAGRDHGSEFTVRLPLAAQPGAVSEVGKARSRRALAASRILIVDDNRDAADTMAELLRIWGNEVEVRYDGRAALELAHAFAPHVAILDIGLPKIDGYELARRLSGQPQPPELLIAVTGYGQEGDVRRVREAGFDYHFIKPIDADALYDALAAVRGYAMPKDNSATHAPIAAPPTTSLG